MVQASTGGPGMYPPWVREDNCRGCTVYPAWNLLPARRRETSSARGPVSAPLTTFARQGMAEKAGTGGRSVLPEKEITFSDPNCLLELKK